MSKKNAYIGSRFDDFLDEDGTLEHAEAVAVKRVIAFQIQQAMKKQNVNKTRMAALMHTSRSAVERLFNPDNQSVTLLTLERAASALGKKLKVELV